MDPRKVVLLLMTSADMDLPDRLVTSEEWLRKLEATPEAPLDEEQRELVTAILGGEFGRG